MDNEKTFVFPETSEKTMTSTNMWETMMLAMLTPSLGSKNRDSDMFGDLIPKGSNVYLQGTEPENPKEEDIWIDKNVNSILIYKNNNWENLVDWEKVSNYIISDSI